MRGIAKLFISLQGSSKKNDITLAMEIKIKRFEEFSLSELYEIMRIRAEVFIVEQNCPCQELDYRDQHSTHMYVEDNGKILSYLRVIDPGVKYPAASIGRVLTVKEARGKGLSRMLMKEAIRFAKELSPVIEIEAQAYLRDFYKSLGFVETSEEYILEERLHIDMKME